MKLEFSLNYKQYSRKLSFKQSITPGRVSISKSGTEGNPQQFRTGHLLNRVSREF